MSCTDKNARIMSSVPRRCLNLPAGLPTSLKTTLFFSGKSITVNQVKQEPQNHNTNPYHSKQQYQPSTCHCHK